MPAVGTAEWWTFVSGLGILAISVTAIVGYAAIHTITARYRRLFMLHELSGARRDAAERAFGHLPECRTRWLQRIDYGAGRARPLRRLRRAGAETVIAPADELPARMANDWRIACRRQGNGACTVYWDDRRKGILLFRVSGG